MSIRSRLTLPLVLALAAVVAPSARAQDVAVASPVAAAAAAPTVAPAGPVAESAIVGVRHQAIADVAAPQRRTSRGQTLMIVGGVAFLVGLVIGGDAGTAIAIGGAGVGLYGLYQYLQ